MIALRFSVVAVALAACSGSPKPCPVATEAKYTAALASACPSALTVQELRACPEYAAIKAQHELEQQDGGCRVK